MEFPEFLSSIFKAITPPSMSDEPTCAKCMNCKARVKQLPSGQQIRVFTCPYTGEKDEFSDILPAVNPSDQTTLTNYAKKYIENLNFIDNKIYTCAVQPGGTSPMKDNNSTPITRYEDLNYCTENLYHCGAFKPRLFIDNDGSSHMKENELITLSPYREYSFVNLTYEDQKALRDM